MKSDLPLVSIWCMTYNHRNYLKDAIESFLRQETDFEYEIIIHDDASTDGTDEIISKYIEMNTKRIKAVIQPYNLYSSLPIKSFNLLVATALEEKTLGKYVALCEGDDFWLDRHKLQLQVDYMEAHSECTLTAHNGVILYTDNRISIEAMDPYGCDKDLSVEELLMWYHGNIPTASMVFKREYAVRKGFFAGTMASGDWEQQLYCAVKGRVHYFDRIMSCYRANTPGSYTCTVWGNDRKRYGIRLDQMYFLRLFDEYTKGVYREFVSEKLYHILITLFEENIDSDMEQFKQMCDEQGRQKDMEYNRFLCQIVEAFNGFKENDFCVEYIKEFVKRHKYLLIMGDGFYGKKMAKSLINSSLDFDGFLVSNGYKQHEEECGKPVWEIKALPFDKNQCGVIVSVGFDKYSEMIQNLLQCGINKYTYLYGIIGD